MKLVAVTSCPTGIAHSQMAAENLEQIATDAGHDIKVEIQGAMGAENELTADEIAAADAVIIAADTAVSRERFESKPVVKGTVKDAINDAEGFLAEAADRSNAGPESERPGDADPDPSAAATDETESSSNQGASSQRRGGDPSKGLLARLKRLFS